MHVALATLGNRHDPCLQRASISPWRLDKARAYVGRARIFRELSAAIRRLPTDLILPTISESGDGQKNRSEVCWSAGTQISGDIGCCKGNTIGIAGKFASAVFLIVCVASVPKPIFSTRLV